MKSHSNHVQNCPEDSFNKMTCVSTTDGNAGIPWKRGFTLIELVVAMALIAVLVSIAIPTFRLYQDKAKMARAKSEIRTLENYVNASFIDRNVLPVQLSDVVQFSNDPWGKAYQYQSFAVPDPVKRVDYFGVNPLNTDYDLYSMGPDGLSAAEIDDEKSTDDILRSGDGGFVGLASALKP